MKIIVEDTYENMCNTALKDLLQLTAQYSSPLICSASGDSPKGLYNQLTNAVQQQQIDTSDWHFVGLDEWAGMNGNDEGSCRFHLNNQLFNPLNVPEEKCCFFDGRAANLQLETRRVEEYIQTHGGIDIAIIGLGMNGHVGMNEPGTPIYLGCHIAEIDLETQEIGQKYFNHPQTLTHGLTMGIANLMQARSILLLVSGNRKARIVKEVLEAEISAQIPATILRNHPGCIIYLDKEAASLTQAH